MVSIKGVLCRILCGSFKSHLQQKYVVNIYRQLIGACATALISLRNEWMKRRKQPQSKLLKRFQNFTSLPPLNSIVSNFVYVFGLLDIFFSSSSVSFRSNSTKIQLNKNNNTLPFPFASIERLFSRSIYSVRIIYVSVPFSRYKTIKDSLVNAGVHFESVSSRFFSF